MMDVRDATADDLLGVLSVLDAAMLQTDKSTVERRIDAGTALVAVEDGRILGACVCVPRSRGAHVEAIAVRQRRRDQGIGSAMIDAATERWGRLTADFDPHLKPFYETFGFDLEQQANGRFRGEKG